MINPNFCPDAFWNASDTWVDDKPDLTECFKQTVLIWVPCGFLLLFLPFDLYNRFNSRHAEIPWNLLNVSKCTVIFLLILLTFYEMVMILGLQDAVDVEISDSQVVSISIKAATFIFVAFLQAVHRIKGHVTSGLLFLFWLILVICSIPQLRSEIQNYDNQNLTVWAEFQFITYIIYFTLITILLLLNCFADKERQTSAYFKTKVNNPSPEQRTSFLNRIFFHWFTHITRVGYKRPLTEDDMFDLSPENTSTELIPSFDKYYAKSVEKGRTKREFMSKAAHMLNNLFSLLSLKKRFSIKKKTYKSVDVTTETVKKIGDSVVPAIIKAYGMPFLYAGFLELILIGLLFVQPFLLDELINFTYDVTTAPVWRGLLLTFGLFSVSFTSAIVCGQFLYQSSLTGLRIKTALKSAIYRKSLRISVATKKYTTSGEIFNLMSVDAERFIEMIHFFHDIWSGPLTVGIAICLLYRVLGVAVFAGLGVMIVVILMSGVLYMQWEKLLYEEMLIKDERIEAMSEAISGMKVWKFYAWETRSQEFIDSIRAEEIKILKKIAVLDAGSSFLWDTTPFLVSLVSYATFVLLGGELTPNIAFVSVALFNIIEFPLGMFPIVVANVIEVLVSMRRINKFMNSEEINPNNVTHNPSENAVSIINGNFSWRGILTTLKNINMKIEKGKMVALVGPVGCGKTSLLSAVLGEMKKISGTVNVDGRIAYVPQQAWIQNATVQDNILFGRPMNEQFYNKVIHACALTTDIAMLPGGDLTEIGENGINLSGGQKQRVALARAVYSEADIYLLDDPLSAVDSHVGKHIFRNILDENTGLLRGKSRLLVTHAVVYLPKVSEVYVMAKGEITESGSYLELLGQNAAFAEFLAQHLLQNDDDEDLEESGVGEKDVVQSISLKSNQISSKSVDTGGITFRERGIDERDMSKLIDEEEAASGSVGVAVYIRFCKSVGVILCVASIICTALSNTVSVYSNVWLTKWSTDSRASNPDDVSWRNMYIGVYAGLVSSKGVLVLAVGIMLGLGCLRAARELHNRLLHNVMRLPMLFFDTTPKGRILNRFSNDINIIDDNLPRNLLRVVITAFHVFSILVVISYSTPPFLAVIIPISIIYYFIQIFYVSTTRQLKRLQSITLSPISNHFSETVTGQSSIRAYGDVNRFISEYHDRIDNNQKMTYPKIVAHSWLAVRLEILGAMIVLFASLFAVLSRQTIEPATVGLSISYALRVSEILNELVTEAAEVQSNIVAIERVDEYSNRQQEAPWKTVPVDPTWPQKGIIKFENFQVRYREGLDLVLKGINFSVKSQEKVGIVGRTGAGKSSLTLALFRIIEAAGGRIIIDDIDIAEIGLHSLRSQLTIIPQDPVLFRDTLRMNIDPYDTYTEDAIWTALERSHLKTFVKGLSEGLNYELGKCGENLSVGQRQLICLARALLRKTKILILDEATAAVDFETDELIQKTIRIHFSDCTILTIAHRLNTIMDSDRVIVLDQGQVAEYDTPKALLKNKNSIFYGMAKDAGLTA